MHLNSLDYFRGLAILFIVAGHTYANGDIDSFYEKVFANLVMGGTTFFVFISGFFFHHAFYPKFQYRQFLWKKAKFVLLPYTFLTLAGVVCFIVYLEHPSACAEVFITGSISHWYQYIWLSAQYWWAGNILAAYWYIPFIMIFFVLSPIFIKQIQLPIKIQVSLFLILLCISTLIHRPLDNFPHLHSVIYFTPVYMLGIICSIKREQVFKFLVGKGFMLGLATVLMSMLQILLYDHYGNFHRYFLLSYDGIDMMLLQKILMCFFLLSVLQKFEHKDLPFLKYIASASFAIYFIHPWVIYFFEYLSDFGHLNIFSGQLGFVVAMPIVLAISLVMAATFKWAFPNKSPFIVGW